MALNAVRQLLLRTWQQWMHTAALQAPLIAFTTVVGPVIELAPGTLARPQPERRRSCYRRTARAAASGVGCRVHSGLARTERWAGGVWDVHGRVGGILPRKKVHAGCQPQPLLSQAIYRSSSPALPLPITAPMSSDPPILPPPDLSPKEPVNGEKKRKRGATRLSCAECRRCI